LRSPFMTSPEALQGVLAKGSEKHRGMPPFTGVLSTAEIENIRAYIIDRARKEKPGDGG
jgi:mono/diheme cytochrome c family protein